MSAYELVTGRATNPGATITAVTFETGQSGAVRSAEGGSGAHLIQMWGENASGGLMRIKSPRMHDNVQGIRVRVPAGSIGPLLPYAVKEKLYETDVLSVETSGGTSETDSVFYINHYSRLPGSEGNFKTWAEIQPRILKYMGVEVTCKSGASAGAFGAPVAINSNMDQFEIPAEYAILGYTVDAGCGAVGFRGTGIGELRCGGPGVVAPDITQEWFVKLSEEAGEGAIPVFGSANKGSVLVEVAHTTASTEFHPTIICALLSS